MVEPSASGRGDQSRERLLVSFSTFVKNRAMTSSPSNDPKLECLETVIAQRKGFSSEKCHSSDVDQTSPSQ